MLVRYILASYVKILLATQLAPWVPEARIDACADSTAVAVVLHGGSPVDAIILAEWRGRESACDDNAVNPDSGAAGAMQQQGIGQHGYSHAYLRAHPDVAMAIWLDDLDRLRVYCGNTRGALGVLSGGKCDAQQALVRARCLQAGLGPGCEG